MKVFVVGADEKEMPEALRCPGVRFVPEPGRVRDRADFVLVAVRGPGDVERVRRTRKRVGPVAFIIAVEYTPGTVAASAYEEAGADDLCLAGETLDRRLPLVLRRIGTLIAREKRLETILDTTVDGIIVMDAQGRVQAFNSAAEKIFGYRADEIVDHSVGLLMPEPYREEHDTYVANYLQTGQAKIIGIGREVVGQRRDGSVFPMELSVSEVRTEDSRTFTGVVRDISERRHLENEVLRISDQERRRIGQDLHDGLGQMLTGIGLIAQNLGRRLREQDSELREEVDEITELIREADHQARSLARGLVPVELDANGLAAALQRLCTNAERLFGVECQFEEVGSMPVRDSTAAINLYRIAQEAVSNAVKHGTAPAIRVTLASGREHVRLRIQDNGIGFPERLNEDRGMGVRIMHYRARVIGGLLEIRRRPEGGTLVTCTLPRLANPALRASAPSHPTNPVAS
jgi:PAS domain S-box-containing protein